DGATRPGAPGHDSGSPSTGDPVASGEPAAGGADGGDARAPMVGVVREVHVAPGDAVNEGDRLITMEAMKMDIYVNAPVSGKVAALHCKPGDTTTEGAVLATVSPAAGGAGAP
ncbi:MAG: acetyl-CoA carboxylase biotin carboxyl carrier protein subunit, partial [Spirochaetota bacterium]